MKTNKFLPIITDLKDIVNYKNLGVTNFAFPLDFFCVGFNKCFKIEEITEPNSYLFINRVLDNESIDIFKTIISKTPKNIIGIIFDDIGVLNVVKDYSLEKILYLNHFNNNIESVNSYLEYVDSLVLSSDITLMETNYILEKGTKPLCVFVVGYQNIMYSRRKLLNNYYKFHKMNKTPELNMELPNQRFLVCENDYGTVFYSKPIFNGLNELYFDNVKFFVINTYNMSFEEFKSIFENDGKIETTNGFLYKKTIYKLKDSD